MGLYLQDYRSDSIHSVSSLNMDMYIAGPCADQHPLMPSTVWDLGRGTLGLGIGLPLDDLETAKEILCQGAALYRDKPGHGVFFTSMGPVTRENNLETIHALVNRRIRIFGGKQLRPNLHIDDMVRAYECFLDAPAEAVHGVPYNVGYQNRSVEDIGLIVRQTLGDEAIELKYEPTDDIRSYHINSDCSGHPSGLDPPEGIFW